MSGPVDRVCVGGPLHGQVYPDTGWPELLMRVPPRVDPRFDADPLRPEDAQTLIYRRGVLHDPRGDVGLWVAPGVEPPSLGVVWDALTTARRSP